MTTEGQDEREATQNAREVVQNDRELSHDEWVAIQRELLQQQTANITQQSANIALLVTSIDKLEKGLDRRPTLVKVIAIMLVLSFISNGLTVGAVFWVRYDIRTEQDKNAEATKTRGEKIIALTERVDDCLDTTVEDGDPIGKCAAESAARFQAAVASVTKDVTCANEKFVLDFIAANPTFGAIPPAPRAECDAEGD